MTASAVASVVAVVAVAMLFLTLLVWVPGRWPRRLRAR